MWHCCINEVITMLAINMHLGYSPSHSSKLLLTLANSRSWFRAPSGSHDHMFVLSWLLRVLRWGLFDEKRGVTTTGHSSSTGGVTLLALTLSSHRGYQRVSDFLNINLATMAFAALMHKPAYRGPTEVVMQPWLPRRHGCLYTSGYHGETEYDNF
jgi:hypothetical protein